MAHLKSCGAQKNLSPDTLKEDPQLLKFYTGIPDWTVFMALYNLVHSAIPDTPINKLSKFSMILMFLMKIRLNLFNEDLGYRFGVHHSTVSRNFHKVLNVMSVRTAHLIKWPDREILYQPVFGDSSRNVVLLSTVQKSLLKDHLTFWHEHKYGAIINTILH